MLSSSFVVRLGTNVTLPAITFAGSMATANGNGALVIDSVNAAVNDLILVANQADQRQNGIFYVVDPGDMSNPFIIDRYPQALGLQIGNIVYVKEGATNSTRLFVVTSVVNMVGSDNSVFSFALSTLVVSQLTEQVACGGVDFQLNFTGITANTCGIKVNGTRVIKERLPAVPGYPIPVPSGIWADPLAEANFGNLVNFVNQMYAGLSANLGVGHGLFN
jgi:hypothetical protein